MTQGRASCDGSVAVSIVQILWASAADVEQRGVQRLPRYGYAETCPVYSILNFSSRPNTKRSYKRPRIVNPALLDPSLRFVGLAIGVPAVPAAIASWNDRQPSRAATAAAMRDAATLADWAGDYVLETIPQ